MDITPLLAIWGAFLSTLLALVEIYKLINEKTSIIVRVAKSYRVSFQNNQQINKPLIRILAANRRQRPITISQITLYAPFGNSVPAKIFPKKDIELAEGKSHSVLIGEEEMGVSADKCVACVIDATGRYFWSHNFIIRLLKIKEPYRMTHGRFKWIFKHFTRK